jgi:hypothetical protein
MKPLTNIDVPGHKPDKGDRPQKIVGHVKQAVAHVKRTATKNRNRTKR